MRPGVRFVMPRGGTPCGEGQEPRYSMRIFDSEESGISVPKRMGKNIEYR